MTRKKVLIMLGAVVLAVGIALAGIWEFPYGEEIVGTITALDTFLGVLLGISTAQYNRENANG